MFHLQLLGDQYVVEYLYNRLVFKIGDMSYDNKSTPMYGDDGTHVGCWVTGCIWNP